MSNTFMDLIAVAKQKAKEFDENSAREERQLQQKREEENRLISDQLSNLIRKVIPKEYAHLFTVVMRNNHQYFIPEAIVTSGAVSLIIRYHENSTPLGPGLDQIVIEHSEPYGSMRLSYYPNELWRGILVGLGKDKSVKEIEQYDKRL